MIARRGCCTCEVTLKVPNWMTRPGKEAIVRSIGTMDGDEDVSWQRSVELALSTDQNNGYENAATSVNDTSRAIVHVGSEQHSGCSISSHAIASLAAPAAPDHPALPRFPSNALQSHVCSAYERSRTVDSRKNNTVHSHHGSTATHGSSTAPSSLHRHLACPTPRRCLQCLLLLANAYGRGTSSSPSSSTKGAGPRDVGVVFSSEPCEPSWRAPL